MSTGSGNSAIRSRPSGAWPAAISWRRVRSLPPLVLDDEEAVALAIALMNAAQSSVAGVAEAAVRALAKVVQVLPKPLQRRVDAVRGMTDRGGVTIAPAQTVDAGY